MAPFIIQSVNMHPQVVLKNLVEAQKTFLDATGITDESRSFPFMWLDMWWQAQ